MRIAILSLVVFSALCLQATAAPLLRAQWADASAPSQTTAIDSGRPYQVGALGLESRLDTSVSFGAFLQLAVASMHSFGVAVLAPLSTWPSRPHVQIAYQFWPMAEGTRGLWLAPSIGLSIDGDAWTSRAALDLGYLWIVDGIAFGCSFGADMPLRAQAHVEVAPRVQFSLGYAW